MKITIKHGSTNLVLVLLSYISGCNSIQHKNIDIMRTGIGGFVGGPIVSEMNI